MEASQQQQKNRPLQSFSRRELFQNVLSNMKGERDYLLSKLKHTKFNEIKQIENRKRQLINQKAQLGLLHKTNQQHTENLHRIYNHQQRLQNQIQNIRQDIMHESSSSIDMIDHQKNDHKEITKYRKAQVYRRQLMKISKGLNDQLIKINQVYKSIKTPNVKKQIPKLKRKIFQ